VSDHPIDTLAGLFEECPADFSFLRMQDTPPAGGDTLWVSGYELYLILPYLVPIEVSQLTQRQLRPPLSTHASVLRDSDRNLCPTRVQVGL
jgi:alpha-ketoglutarate-dependent taurine dioxygenase